MNWWSECGESAARPEANHSSISSSLLISFHSHSMKTKKRFHSKDVLKLADIITVLDCTNRYCNDLGWSVVRCEKPIEHRYILFSFHVRYYCYHNSKLICLIHEIPVVNWFDWIDFWIGFNFLNQISSIKPKQIKPINRKFHWIYSYLVIRSDFLSLISAIQTLLN